MLGENDGPSMLSYSATGATYGIGFFAPFIVLTFAMAYIVQEMVVRVGIATRRGHAELIVDRFGPAWGLFSVVDLAAGNLLTLVTEFVALRAGAAYFGIPPAVSVVGGAIVIIASLAARRYLTWERTALALAIGNLLFIPAALLARPDPNALVHALATWGPLPGGADLAFVTLLMANIGATVTPWMLFFQQGAVVDKGLTRLDLSAARWDTALGAAVAAVIAVATLATASLLFTHHVQSGTLATGADFASALKPFIGSTGASLFALGMMEAGVVAGMTISTSSGYAICEVLRRTSSLNAEFSTGKLMYLTCLASVVCAGAVVLIPGTPLLAVSITVNVIATLLMAPALIFVYLLANDRELMTDLRNSQTANALGGAVIAVIFVIGAAYAALTGYQLFSGRI